MTNIKNLFIFVMATILTCSGCWLLDQEKIKTEEEAELTLLWEYAYDFDGGAPEVKPYIFDNYVITSGDTKITSNDINTGEIVWKTPFEHHRQLLNSSFGVIGNIIVGTKVKSVQAWEILTGQELWEISSIDSIPLSIFKGILTINNDFYTPSKGTALYKINADANFEIINLDARTYEMIHSDKVIFAGQTKGVDGIFSAYNAETMELIWRFEPPGISLPIMPPILEEGVIYFGTTYATEFQINAFFALDAATGLEIWRQDRVMTYNAVLEGDYIYVNNGGGVVKLRKADGRIIWETDFKSSGAAPIDYGYGYVYAPHNGRMKILDAETGEIVHQLDPPHGSFFWLVTAEAGRIFAQSNRYLYAFAPWGHTEPLKE